MGDEPIKTPFGSIMEYAGIPQEKIVSLVESFLNAPPKGQQYGLAQYQSEYERNRSERENRNRRTAELISKLVPHETTARGAVISQISPIYHGSPYRFNKFKNEAIGTGEGAQAFGYGHYMTEAPEIALTYAKPKSYQHSQTGWKVGDMTVWESDKIMEKPYRVSIMNQYANGKTMDEIVTGLEARKKSVSGNKILYNELDNAITFAKSDFFKQNKISLWNTELSPNIYEATLHKGKKPGEYEYLRWDESITKQGAVLDKIKDVFKKRGFEDWQIESMAKREVTGEQVYKYIASNYGEKEASALLKQMGIDGIKYPAGSLSGVKSDKFNYVVFDPEDITIEAVR